VEFVYGTKKWIVSHEGPTSLNMKGTSDRQKHEFEAILRMRVFGSQQ
jgi:hypothetical protein